MAECCKGKADHCWHVETSSTNGLGVNGWDVERCCHCGIQRHQHWVWEADPAHGQYADARIRRNTRIRYDVASGVTK